MSTPIVSSLNSEISQLTPEQQNQVLEFVRSLKSATDKKQRRQAILKTAGSIPPDDIERMRQAIAERPYALAAGDFEVPASFDDPLPDDVLQSFGSL